MRENSDTVVLVADDEPSTLALVAEHARSKGFKVIEASDGDMAWQLAHQHLPDLVILDVMMPGMSGWEVCRKIRESLPLAHTGVIMLTGIGQNLNEMTSPLYGADTHVDKPFEFSDLDEKIELTLKDRRKGTYGRADRADEEGSSPVNPPPGSDDAPLTAPTGGRRLAGKGKNGGARTSTPPKAAPTAKSAKASPPVKKAAAKKAGKKAAVKKAGKKSPKPASKKTAAKAAPKAAKKSPKPAPRGKKTAKKAPPSKTAKKATAKKTSKPSSGKPSRKKASAKGAKTITAPSKKVAKGTKATAKKAGKKKRAATR